MSTGAYVAHRENQRELILETAEELFINKGIEQVTIGDIAAKSRLTRATIYKYFSKKEEMAGEIFKNVTKGWVERDEREAWTPDGSGYEQIERFVISHFNYLFWNVQEARFIAEFNYMYSKKLSVEAAMKLFSENLEGERLRLLACIRQGQADGLASAKVLARSPII
jgi:AcrR family transcriptional regulator